MGIKHVSEGVKVAVEDYAGQVYLADANVQSSEQLQSWIQDRIENTEEGYVVPIVPLEKAGSEPEKPY